MLKDNYDLFKKHDEGAEEWLKARPKCCVCEEYIQDDELWELDDEIYCKECAKENFWDIESDNFKIDTEKYMERHGYGI